MRKLLINYPLKQGLKRDDDDEGESNDELLINYPLKQGLKLQLGITQIAVV